MKKNLLKLILLLFFNSLLCEKQTNIKSWQSYYTPENTLFAFDLHDVLLKTNYWEAIGVGFRELSISDMLFIIGHKEVRRKFKAAFNNKITVEKMLDDLGKNNKRVKKLKEPILKMVNCQNINQDVLELAHEIKDLGFRLYLLSNIGIQALNNLYKRYPHLDNLFDGFYVPSPDNNYIRKPSLYFFSDFKRYIRKIGDKQENIIFIDDLKENVETAQKIGLKPILFKSKKQLEQDLKKMGINLKTSLCPKEITCKPCKKNKHKKTAA